jgi:hypothetical protein
VEKYGLEKLEPMVLYIKQHQSEQYFPTITTPLQLKDKMAQLINHVNQNKNKQPKIVKIS